MLTCAMAVSQVVAFVRALLVRKLPRAALPVLLALTALLVSAPASASTLPARTPVTSTREAPSAERHVSALTLRVPHVRANARRLGAPGARSAASTSGRAAPLTARGRHHGALQGAGDFSAGVSSALTFGLSDKLIGATGLGRYGSKCSTAHAVGRGAGFALGLVGASIASLGKAAVVEGAEAAGGVEVLFGQSSVGRTFTTADAGSTFKYAGESIADVAAGLRTGAIEAIEIPVGVVNIEGQLVAVNNRSLTALTRAGLSPTKVVDLSGDASVVQKVLGRLADMGGAPSATIRIRGMGAGASAIY